jgi:hypothetical protein
MRLFNAAAAVLTGVALCGPALAGSAPSLKGDWMGTIDAPAGPERMGLRLGQSPDGSWQGVFDSIDQGSRNIPVADVEATQGRLAFNVPGFDGRYEGQWDEKAGAWRGAFRQPGGSIALDLRRAAIPPAPRVKGLDGDWEGVIPNGDDPQQIVLHVTTTAQDGTLATIDNLTTRIGGMPIAHIEKRGAAVKLRMTALDLLIEGELTSDARTLKCAWIQDKKSVALTLNRRAGP